MLRLLHAQCIFTHPNPFGQRGVWMTEKFGHKWVEQAAQDGGFEVSECLSSVGAALSATGQGNYLNTKWITFHLMHNEISFKNIIVYNETAILSQRLPKCNRNIGLKNCFSNW